jgi:hypothetical protein
LVPASAQHNSSRSKSMLSELGSFTAVPFRKTDRPVPSEFAHSNFGDSRFQSDQNTFLHNIKNPSILQLISRMTSWIYWAKETNLKTTSLQEELSHFGNINQGKMTFGNTS